MSKAVIYYSLTGNTKEAAKEIARKLGAKLFEIDLAKPLPRKPAAKMLVGGMQSTFGRTPKIKGVPDNIDYYDEIILGMPLFEEENITQTLYRKQRDEAIRKALVLLPPQKRRICQMKIFEGLSNAEIAQQLNITVNTVKVSYYKAILSLRESLNEKDFICICMVLLSASFS